MMLGRINEGRIFVRTVPSPRCVSGLDERKGERERWNMERRKEKGERERSLSVYDQRCGSRRVEIGASSRSWSKSR